MERLAIASKTRRTGRKLQPVVESLEGRLLLYASTSNHFTVGANMSISFVPDGTDLGGVQSNLFATFDKIYGANNWEPKILSAAAFWESYANINFTTVSDNGDPISSGPYQQGNPNFGDIRIGGFTQSSSSLAYTIAPPPANGDSSSGDIFFNTNAQFGGSGGYDLQTVALHELGHALGLAHSTDTSAAMYASYMGTKAEPAQDDINGIQAYWGPRVNDSYTQKYGNQSLAKAADVTSQINQYNQVWLTNLNVTKPKTGYFFKVTTPANSASVLTAIVQSTGWSLLAPQIQIYSTSSQLLAQNMGKPSAFGDTENVSINATPNTTYVIRVLGNTNGATNTGAYSLNLNMGNYYPLALNAYVNQVPVTQSQGGGGSNLVINSKHQQIKDDFDFTSLGKLPANGDIYSGAVVKKQHQTPVTHVQLNQKHPTRRSVADRSVTPKLFYLPLHASRK